MSGLEIIGIAASIIQIADVGVNVSVKLCTFVHQIKNVNQSVQSLSNDVALTSSVLRHLGENLQQDEQAQLCSTQALALAQSVLGECEKLFDQINAAIEQPAPNDVKSRLLRSVRKVTLALSERELDALRSNLDRLKSTMLLMLNVIMYAGQLRSRKDSVDLQDQRSLVQALAEKRNRGGQFGQVLCALPSTQQDAAFSMAAVDTGSKTHVDPAVPENLPEDLQTYFLLMKRLLGEVDLCQSKLQPKRYISIRNGLLRVHTDEQVELELQYGQDTCQILHRALFVDKDTGGMPMNLSSCIEYSAQEDTDDHNSPGLQPSKTHYEPREEPPPFLVVEHNTALDQASTGGQEGRLPRPRKPDPESDSVLISYLTPNRPDITEYERLDPLSSADLPSRPDIVHSDLQLQSQRHQSPLPPPQYDSASDRLPEEPQPEPLRENNPLPRPISETNDPSPARFRRMASMRPKRPRFRRERGVERADEPDVSVEPCRDIVDSLLLAWTTLSSDEVSVSAAYVQE